MWTLAKRDEDQHVHEDEMDHTPNCHLYLGNLCPLMLNTFFLQKENKVFLAYKTFCSRLL